jgi:hypothetical protein
MAILAMVVVGQSLQSQVHLNHDVSYFVHFDRWLLQGRSLGSDLFDGNLPMVWALFMPAAALAQMNLLSEPDAVRLVFWFYFLVSTTLLVHVLSRSSREQHAGSVGWVIGFVLISTLGPGFSFGQREHASVLFAMPYLAVAALRLQGGSPPGNAVLACIGLLAGVGFALKPYFVVVPALVELLLLVRLGWRSLLARVESLVLALTVIAYVALAGFFLYDYLKFTIDLTLAAYWAYDTANFAVVLERWLHVAQPIGYGLAIALVTRTWSAQHSVVLLAGLGYSICYFVQSKGYVYHAYPVFVCAVTFLGICLGRGLVHTWTNWRETGRALSLALVPAVVLLSLPTVKQVHDGIVDWYFTYNTRLGRTGQFRQAVIDLVNHFAPSRRSYFYAFSTHPFPGFPTASYTSAEWSGRSIVQPFIPAYARLDEVKDDRIRGKVIEASEYQRRMVLEDFERRPPSIVFVERSRSRLGMNRRQFDDIAFYTEDPRFRQIWQEYEEYPPLGPLRVFVRRSEDLQLQ